MGKPDTSSVRPHRAKWYSSVEYTHDSGFQSAVGKQVDDYFATAGHPRTGSWNMVLKSGVILGVFFLAYALLVFVAETPLQAVILSVLVGFAAAGIGVNIQHDGGHRAYSKKNWVNSLAAGSLDLIGGSSCVWRWKHTRFHHTYVNLTNYDADLDMGGIGRISPHQKRRWFHRLQHLYLWPLYSLLAIKWQLFDDFAVIATGRLGVHSIPRPKGKDLLLFIGGFDRAFVASIRYGFPKNNPSQRTARQSVAPHGIISGLTSHIVAPIIGSCPSAQGGEMKYREALIYIAACLLVWLSCGEQINPKSPGLSDPTSRKQSPDSLDSASLEAMKAMGAIFRAVDSSLLINPAHDDSVTFPSFELIFDSL